jgi:hypothetical protein
LYAIIISTQKNYEQQAHHMHEGVFDYMFKIIIIDDPDIEKTNSVLQICLSVFAPQSKFAIRAELQVKTIKVETIGVNENSSKVQIWDTTREENISQSTSTIINEQLECSLFTMSSQLHLIIRFISG